MRKIGLPAVVAATSMVVIASAGKAEPMTLSASEMDSVTAGALIEVNVPINVATGDVLVQTNITTQVATAIAVALANCGVCAGGAPAASSLAGAINANVSRLIQR
jgi:hypothetical protein